MSFLHWLASTSQADDALHDPLCLYSNPLLLNHVCFGGRLHSCLPQPSTCSALYISVSLQKDYGGHPNFAIRSRLLIPTSGTVINPCLTLQMSPDHSNPSSSSISSWKRFWVCRENLKKKSGHSLVKNPFDSTNMTATRNGKLEAYTRPRSILMNSLISRNTLETF